VDYAGVVTFNGTPGIPLDGPNHLIKRVFANRAIVRYGLDIQKTSVGVKADLP